MALYRNIRAREQLDIFFASAVTSLLLVRFYLYLAGYPQIGSGNFHIAHMLWGGLLMLLGIVLMLSFLGAQAQRISALLGGLGFGVFIDEIGKFITSDNNYFYRPAIGIIYAIFVCLYLAFNFLSRDERLNSREYQLNALAELEEAIAHDMDVSEKTKAKELLAKADQNSKITKDIGRLLEDIETIPDAPKNRIDRFFTATDKLYRRFWRQRNSSRFVRIFFVAEAGLFFIGVIGGFYSNIDELIGLFFGEIDYGKGLLVAEFVSSLVAAIIAVKGALVLKRSRLRAFELFRRATIINLFLTEFFTFTRIQFEALPGFILNVSLLVVISYVIHQEERLTHNKPV